jgi:DNA-binding MarR family transcriptional regulator
MQPPDSLVATLQEWFGIFRRRMMGSFFSYARDRGLTVAQLGAMFHIYQKGACGVSDIGSDLGVTNSAASQMLERLVQLKLITRSEDPTDRRVKQIVLTDKGRQILQESSKANQVWLEDLVQTMAAEEREQIRSALVLLIDKARHIETSPS